MPVKSKPQAYACSDGEEFPTKKEAELHEELIEAVNNFRLAKERLGRATAATVKTADGDLFDFHRWNTYWFVSKHGAFGPAMRQVQFGYGTGVNLGGGDNARVELVLTEGDRHIYFAIAEIYSREENARKALAQAIREHITTKEEELAELAKEKK